MLDAAWQPVSIDPGGAPGQDVIVWMDHRAGAQAERINATGHPVLRYVGGRKRLSQSGLFAAAPPRCRCGTGLAPAQQSTRSPPSPLEHAERDQQLVRDDGVEHPHAAFVEHAHDGFAPAQTALASEAVRRVPGRCAASSRAC